MIQEQPQISIPTENGEKTNHNASSLRNILRIGAKEEFIQYVADNIKKKTNPNLKKILDSGNFFNEESLINEYGNFLKFEELFIRKVLEFVERGFEKEPNKKLVLLFDLDETLLTKGEDSLKVDYLRPSFRFIWLYLRQKYKDKIEFGVLTSRGQGYELPTVIKKYMNPKLCFSTRDSTFSINGTQIYVPRGIIHYFPKESEFLEENGITDKNCVNVYYDKAYGLLKIRQADSSTNYVAIDDCFNYGNDKERKFTIIEQGIALGVYDCMFLSNKFI